MNLDLKVKLDIYNHFAEFGQAPSPEQISQLIHESVDSILGAYQRLNSQRVLVLEKDNRSIRMAPPFSDVETQHVVEVGDIAYFANCAWDALGIAAALHKPATVHSRCEHSFEPLQLEIELSGPEISDWLFHCVVPAAQWWDDIVFT